MDEAWKMFEKTGKITDYLSYRKPELAKWEGFGGNNSTSSEHTAATERKERETGWDRQSF